MTSPPPSSPVAFRLRRPYATEDEFLASDGPAISRGGMILIGAGSRPVGLIVRFEIALWDGSPLFRGEGRVVTHMLPGPDVPFPGLEIRFTRLDPRGKSLVERALRERDLRRDSEVPELLPPVIPPLSVPPPSLPPSSLVVASIPPPPPSLPPPPDLDPDPTQLTPPVALIEADNPALPLGAPQDGVASDPPAPALARPRDAALAALRSRRPREGGAPPDREALLARLRGRSTHLS